VGGSGWSVPWWWCVPPGGHSFPDGLNSKVYTSEALDYEFRDESGQVRGTGNLGDDLAKDFNRKRALHKNVANLDRGSLRTQALTKMPSTARKCTCSSRSTTFRWAPVGPSTDISHRMNSLPSCGERLTRPQQRSTQRAPRSGRARVCGSPANGSRDALQIRSSGCMGP
jgi:hypothetical protein